MLENRTLISKNRILLLPKIEIGIGIIFTDEEFFRPVIIYSISIEERYIYRILFLWYNLL